MLFVLKCWSNNEHVSAAALRNFLLTHDIVPGVTWQATRHVGVHQLRLHVVYSTGALDEVDYPAVSRSPSEDNMIAGNSSITQLRIPKDGT